MESNNDTLKRYYSKKQKRKKRKKYAFYTVLTVFFVILVTVLSLTVFFNINDIAVTGNAKYSTETIIKVSGLQKGQNLFRLNKFKVIEGMHSQLPYLSEITIDRHLPVGIEIIVKESKPFLCLQNGNSYFILDENLKILESVSQKPENLPLVTGVKAKAPSVGQYLTDDAGASNRLKTLSLCIKKKIGDNKVTFVDVTSSYDVSFGYMDRIEVRVGSVEQIDQKIELVKRVIDENQSNEKAIIEISSDLRAHYRPVEEIPEDEQTEQTEEENSSKENE